MVRNLLGLGSIGFRAEGGELNSGSSRDLFWHAAQDSQNRSKPSLIRDVAIPLFFFLCPEAFQKTSVLRSSHQSLSPERQIAIFTEAYLFYTDLGSGDTCFE